MLLSRCEGQLGVGGKNKQTITLSFKRQEVNLYSTYLTIVNKTNPADVIKAIRVIMQVVTNKNEFRTDSGQLMRYFDVRLDGHTGEDSPSCMLVFATDFSSIYVTFSTVFSD